MALSTELEITSAIARSLIAQDERDHMTLNEHWADDAELRCLGGAGEVFELKGRDDVLSFLLERDKRMAPHVHFMGNAAIELDEDGEAVATYMVLCPECGGQAGQPPVSHFQDRVVKKAGGWVIVAREMRALDHAGS